MRNEVLYSNISKRGTGPSEVNDVRRTCPNLTASESKNEKGGCSYTENTLRECL